MENTREITGKFVSRFLLFGVVIGVISFLLENLIPQWLDLEYGVAVMIIQTALFFISTMLIAKLAITATIGKNKFTKDEAKTIVKSIRVLLIIVAIIIMFFNFFYCGNLYISARKDIDNDVKGNYTELADSEKEEAKKEDKQKIIKVTAIYLVVKEIVTIGSYAYIATYMRSKVNKKIKKEE